MLIDRAMLATRFIASDDPTRHNLTGVYLTPEHAVATDGHMLARVKATSLEGTQVDPEPLKPCIVSAEDCAKLDKALPKRGTVEDTTLLLDVKEANANGHVPMVVGSSSFKPAKVDGEFPDYAQVYPSTPVAFRVTFNAAYLAELAKVARAAMDSNEKNTILTLEFYADDADGTKLSGAINPTTRELDANGYSSPIGVKCAKAPRFDALLMPCRP
jgi:DNA polymerase III sliding clamp (beta) subunit (PCNA family)